MPRDSEGRRSAEGNVLAPSPILQAIRESESRTVQRMTEQVAEEMQRVTGVRTTPAQVSSTANSTSNPRLTLERMREACSRWRAGVSPTPDRLLGLTSDEYEITLTVKARVGTTAMRVGNLKDVVFEPEVLELKNKLFDAVNSCKKVS